jgi:hypothetical protein
VAYRRKANDNQVPCKGRCCTIDALYKMEEVMLASFERCSLTIDRGKDSSTEAVMVESCIDTLV